MNSILGLDVGDKRVGVAIAHDGLRVALPLTTLDRNSDNFWQELLQVMKQNDVAQLVIGLPRGLDGQDTAQTAAVQAFGGELANHTATPYVWQDEAVTSVQAETILKQQGKLYAKADIDAMAASLILGDFLEARTSSVTGGEVQ